MYDLDSLSGKAKTCLIPIVLKQFLGSTQTLIGRAIETISGVYPFKDQAQTALFKNPVRTAQ
jgi:hypothetical protein